MRYLIHESQRDEMAARQEYLYDIFHLYFLPGKPEGKYIPLLPVGEHGPDVLFITGHTNYVDDYLTEFLFRAPEKYIVITSCEGKRFKKYITKTRKEIYVPSLRERLCHIRAGADYGFGFDISDTELDFYNTRGSIEERICSAYEHL